MVWDFDEIIFKNVPDFENVHRISDFFQFWKVRLTCIVQLCIFFQNPSQIWKKMSSRTSTEFKVTRICDCSRPPLSELFSFLFGTKRNKNVLNRNDFIFLFWNEKSWLQNRSGNIMDFFILTDLRTSHVHLVTFAETRFASIVARAASVHNCQENRLRTVSGHINKYFRSYRPPKLCAIKWP